MSAYELTTLLQKWEKGELTNEQAVGQVLLMIKELSDRVGKLERRLVEKRPSNKLLQNSSDED
ncbi:MAG: hypothetical protein GY796_13680 [Chloroflexi bacterium]|nr:hypothetical protein [Chloroflexota bacterium]